MKEHNRNRRVSRGFQHLRKKQKYDRIKRMKEVIRKEPELENIHLAERFGCDISVPLRLKQEMGIKVMDWKDVHAQVRELIL